MNFAKPLFGALASLTLAACMGTPGEVEEPVGSVQQAAQQGPHSCHGVLTANALTANALTANALTPNALTANALTANALTANGLGDPNSRELLKYVVSCALTADEHIDVTVEGVTYSFDGQLGLAPEWGEPDGHCGKACQGWVSACVLARVDFLGQPREISLRGQNQGLEVTSSECSAYTQREATYYGNVFASPQQRFACLSPGQTQDTRVCGPSIDGCVVNVVGACDDVCGHQRDDGSFPDCRAPDGDDEHGDGHKKHDADDVYHGSITVFLQP
jgi:hypothetical protein